MKIINYKENSSHCYGVLLNEKVLPLKLLYTDIKTFEDVIAVFDASQIKDYIEHHSEQLIPYEQLTIDAPILFSKRNVFCLGKNYMDHALEMKGKTTDAVVVPDAPIYFSKTCAPALGHLGTIEGHVGVSEKLDYEVELALIIGKSGKNISPEEAKDYIFGYTIVNDISARDLQVKHIQWHRGKSLDDFCPMGPSVLLASHVSYPPDLEIKCYVNDELRQQSRTSNLIFDIDTIIGDLSKGMTLMPGDIILTGTPAGVGMGFEPPKYLKSGDTVTCEIEKIGQLINYIK